MGKKVSFLIVSGNKSRVQRCTDVLSKHFENCTVFHGAEWFEAKYKLDNVHPKAVLIDEHLPKGTGFEIVGKILKDKNNDDIAIVVMTAEKDHEMFASEIASGKEATTSAPSARKSVSRLITILSRPGSGRPMLSHVRRPIRIGLPIVSALKRLRSLDRRQGSPPPRPITPFSAIATRIASSMAFKSITGLSDSQRGLPSSSGGE